MNNYTWEFYCNPMWKSMYRRTKIWEKTGRFYVEYSERGGRGMDNGQCTMDNEGIFLRKMIEIRFVARKAVRF